MQLTVLCCQIIARELAGLSVANSRLVIDSLPSVQTIELVWQLLCRNFHDSTILYLLIQNHVLIRGNLNKTDWHGHFISYCKMNLPNCNLVENIRFFNDFQRQSLYQFFTVLRLEGHIEGLEFLVNLQSLIALSVASVGRPEKLIKSWHRALQVDRTRWVHLRVLNVPQLRSPKLFFDTWELIPSLLWLGAHIDPSVVKSVPKLDQLVESAPAKSPMELLHWLQNAQRIQLNGIVIIELEVSKRFSICSMATYSSFEARDSKLVDAHGYIRKSMVKRTAETSSNGPTNKRPKHRSITKRTSLQQFFGWGRSEVP
ncbi:ZYBA0S10-00650g1_1 [Zygosaccharomyces bailii CLIB 213]|uniref:ZYBA0S10-00650g1_1 n=1 Tax=Zygosaccharomyces bailii (strain CLIB 213 / ATCC 58445 / CBS 680 / BCRC 21525 / NBRC 1098 / NCYC 1416 / NRRL Y-2227) TaxID=1333698 RepID=A0A8J2TA52_ZYGB2|nr:ZYBA0S10-00650g1_1 [Zygosaccharomyces bailii CLIB 213]